MTGKCAYCKSPLNPGSRAEYCKGTNCRGHARADNLAAAKIEITLDTRFAKAMRGKRYDDPYPEGMT